MGDKISLKLAKRNYGNSPFEVYKNRLFIKITNKKESLRKIFLSFLSAHNKLIIDYGMKYRNNNKISIEYYWY